MLNRSASLVIQHAFSKPCLVNLISKDTHLVFSILGIVYSTLTEKNSSNYSTNVFVAYFFNSKYMNEYNLTVCMPDYKPKHGL